MREFKGKSLVRYLEDYTVVDLETTGLSSTYDAIIEVSAIRVRGGEETETFSMLVNPHQPLDPFIRNLTGIDDQMLAQAADITEVLLAFENFVGQDIIVGHNVNFDIDFLYDHFLRYLGELFSNDFVDTLRMARIALDLPHNRLDDLVAYYQIPARDKHRALNDCYLTDQVYRHLVATMKAKRKSRSTTAQC